MPSLVNLQAGTGLIDFRQICLCLDGLAPMADRLHPDRLATTIDAQLTVVDGLPNYQLLVGRTPTANDAADSQSDTLAAFSRRKVARCDTYPDARTQPTPCWSAPAAKRAKQASSAATLFSPTAVITAAAARTALDDLEAALALHDGPWP